MVMNVGGMVMRKPSYTSALAFGCALLLSSSTWAATIEPGQGTLSINQGQGFQPINNRVDGNVGDSVMVSPGGAATVVYGDGCRVDVQPGVVTTIAPLSPCASGSYAQQQNNWCTSDQQAQQQYGTNCAGFLIVGAGVAGLTAFAIYEATKPSSP